MPAVEVLLPQDDISQARHDLTYLGLLFDGIDLAYSNKN